MKLNKSLTLLTAAAGLIGILTPSCSDEISQFEGQGQLKMKMIVNSEVTRADVDDASLADKCVVYISNQEGLIHKYQGLDNVPSDLWLKSGRYVAEAWTGDSVSASFDKKFYRAYEPFEIHPGVNNVVLNCKIANVVASVNRDRISSEMLPSFSVTVANTKGELVFDSENINDAHGYFMMPDGETSLTYTITGRNILGTEFTKTGEIPDVERAHEYVLNLSYDPDANPYDVGGAFITIAVDDRELLIEDNITIHALPQLTALGTDISTPITGPKESFADLNLVGACYGEYSRMHVTFSDAAAFGTQYPEYELTNLAEVVRNELTGLGLTWQYGAVGENSQMRLKIPASMLNALDNGSYTITVGLTDGLGRAKDYTIAIEVSDASVIALPVNASDITSYTALVKATVVKPEAANPGVRFRKKGDAAWQSVVSENPGATDLAFRLSNLQAATTYEVQAIADGYVNNSIIEFTTEPTYAIPNASFEDWSKYSFGGKDVLFPGTGSAPTFWSSGNAGSMKMNVLVTEFSTAMTHSGQYSIYLHTEYPSLFGVGKMAAGNVFAGDYMKTDGTDGELLWGREMPTCHPMKLSGWANYRPSTVEWNINDGPLATGTLDKGTVYVAVTTQKVDVKTKTKVFFDKDADYVLAYGEVVWDGNFGPDGQLEHFEIPITWKNRNYDGQMYLIVVASSSKYGDYFDGGYSVMYLDDLELSYE